MLELRSDTMPTKMLPWLVSRFDESSRFFDLENGKGFPLTPSDVHDVFCIPIEGRTIHRCRLHLREELDPDFEYKRELRDIFDGKQEIHLSEVEKKIATLVDGGELFKNLFVLHVLSSLLTPTRKRTVDMRLAKVVSVVDEIKGYN